MRRKGNYGVRCPFSGPGITGSFFESGNTRQDTGNHSIAEKSREKVCIPQ